ncbi:unnamed protein product [Paramecium pentaurelia]|uniref:Uncharacterized protein n=1 Tax=Paramecium pentaurelia TaxID=43138 RepID=A0A8S1Y516_9CILI|nr:unnamed protein product [Paramecium pentaurelia]
MKQELVAPKPYFSILKQQQPSTPDDVLSYNSSKSMKLLNNATLKVRYDRFGNVIDKKRRDHQISFRDKVTKQQRVYDLFVFDQFKYEYLQIENSKQQKKTRCCSIQ